MIKYSDDVCKVDVKGSVYEVRFPLIDEAIEYEKRIQKAFEIGSDKHPYEIQKDFLMSMGLPEEVFDQVSHRFLTEITNVLRFQKKS